MELTARETAQVEIISAIAQVIKELKQVPSGHLYARLAGHMTLETYEGVISLLIKTGWVKRTNHLLTWAGQ
jgi:hypothetical protein